MFLPHMNYHSWQLDGAEFIPIAVHMRFQSEAESITCNKNNHTIQFSFMWTNSLLMSLTLGDLLLAMDNTVTVILYSDIVGSFGNRWMDIALCLNRSVPPSQSATDDLQQAMALFLSQVCT